MLVNIISGFILGFAFYKLEMSLEVTLLSVVFFGGLFVRLFYYARGKW
ncbi:hypothetical protein TUM3792_45870 [Shewanella sp. MBTL60-007]|nr:hypothetical protein TUM3792_45870 [Shewanella sp. MBTL60-007]